MKNINFLEFFIIYLIIIIAWIFFIKDNNQIIGDNFSQNNFVELEWWNNDASSWLMQELGHENIENSNKISTIEEEKQKILDSLNSVEKFKNWWKLFVDEKTGISFSYPARDSSWEDVALMESIPEEWFYLVSRDNKRITFWNNAQQLGYVLEWDFFEDGKYMNNEDYMKNIDNEFLEGTHGALKPYEVSHYNRKFVHTLDFVMYQWVSYARRTYAFIEHPYWFKASILFDGRYQNEVYRIGDTFNWKMWER